MGEMTVRERLLTAYSGGTPDKVPFGAYHWSVCYRKYGCFCWMHEMKLAKEYGWDVHIRLNTLPKPNHVLSNYVYNIGPSPTEQYHSFYEDLDEVNMTLKIKRGKKVTYVERVIETPAGALKDVTEHPIPGTGYGWLPNPKRLEPLIKGKEDVERIRYLLNPKPLKNRLEDAKEIIKYVGENGLVITTLYSPLDYLLGEAMDQTQLLTLYYDDRNLLEELLGIFQEFALRSVKPYLEIGVKVPLMGWIYASPSYGWSPVIWEQILYPLLKEQVDFVHSYGAYALFYDDGKMKDTLPFLKRAGIDCVETLTPPPVGDVTLSEAREIMGSKVCLKGGLDSIGVLQKGDRESIERQVERLIREGSEGGPYILFNSATISWETPLENVEAYVKAAHKYREKYRPSQVKQ